MRCPVPAREVIDAAREAGLLAGIAMDSPRLNGIGDEHELLIAVTEKRTKDEMDALVACLEGLAA